MPRKPSALPSMGRAGEDVNLHIISLCYSATVTVAQVPEDCIIKIHYYL